MDLLDPSEFSDAHARHLLRRSLVGPTRAECVLAAKEGLEATLDKLFTTHAVNMSPVGNLLDGPVASDVTPYNSPEYTAFFNEKNKRYEDTIQWWYEAIVRSPTSIQERMVWFWHALLPVSFNGSHYAEHVIDYVTLIREHALGNVNEILKRVSMTLAMQLILDDTSNEWNPDKQAVNENHAREMLELHFMGHADRYGNPNYLQEDVVALAHSLSGWRTAYWWEEGADGVRTLMNIRHAVWREEYWDPRPKTLFGKTDTFDTPKAIDHILEVGALKIARHVCKRLYIEFVNEQVDEDVVDALAEHLVQNSMEIQPTLRRLLSSKHFYDERHRMSLLQTPARFVLGLLRSTNVEFVPDFDPRFRRRDPDLMWRLRAFGHSLGQPPNVSGWVSGSDWLSAPSLIRRITFAQKYARGKIIAMDYITGKTCHTFSVQNLMHAMDPELNPQQLAATLCDYFLEVQDKDIVQYVSNMIALNNPTSPREALAQIFQSFRAQLH